MRASTLSDWSSLNFGFCMAVAPADPDTAFIVPLESDEFRCVPQARLRVYVTRDAGRSWKASTRGLPQKDAYETVLRDAMGVDALEPTGVYFGTRSGKLYASRERRALLEARSRWASAGDLRQGGARYLARPARHVTFSPLSPTRATPAMSIAFYVPSYLRAFTEGNSRVELSSRPTTVGAALESLWALHPGVRDRVVTEQGDLRPHINVFVGEESIRFAGGFQMLLPEDCEIAILPAVSGGVHRC